MASGLYAACSAMMARAQALGVLANNLANVNTTGYKGESQFYQALNAAAGKAAPGALNAAVNRYGILAGQGLNLDPGSLQKTSNPMDVAIHGPGFLEVRTKAGVLYTRAGNLQVNAQGELTTAEGDPVLGSRPSAKAGAKSAPPSLANDQPIHVPPGAVSISSDGTVSVHGALVGKLRLVEFKPGTPLSPMGDAYVSAPAGSAHAATGSSLESGVLESSNVNAIQAETDLIGLQRHFDLLSRAMKILNTDFDQTAAVDLPRLNR